MCKTFIQTIIEKGNELFLPKYSDKEKLKLNLIPYISKFGKGYCPNKRH